MIEEGYSFYNPATKARPVRMSNGTSKAVISDAKIVSIDRGMYPKDVLKRLDGIGKSYFSGMIDTSKYTLKGGLAGLASGWLIAVLTGKNKLFCTVLGVVSGTVLGHLYGKMTVNNLAKLKEQQELEKNKENNNI